MALEKYVKYRNIPFCKETRHSDFYTYVNMKELANECETSKEEIIKCRTLGILQSQNGKFWLSDIDATGMQPKFKIRVSMVYVKSPPQSTFLPYPVQVFGVVQWRNTPVIFPRLLQVLSVPMAIKMKDIMTNIATVHLATSYQDCSGDDCT